MLPPAPEPRPAGARQPVELPDPVGFGEAKAARIAELEAREDRENLRTARWALILALIPLGVTQFLALLLATVACARYHASGRPVAGRDRARAARRLALLQLGLVTVVGGWWLIYEGPRRRAELARQNFKASQENLRQIAIACQRFRSGPGQGQRYPLDWSELLAHGLLAEETLRSPADHRATLSSYTYEGRKPMLVPPEQFVLAYETFADHRVMPEKGHLVAFADGRVEWVPAHRFQSLINQHRRGPDR